jgi:hypothetical protein
MATGEIQVTPVVISANWRIRAQRLKTGSWEDRAVRDVLRRYGLGAYGVKLAVARWQQELQSGHLPVKDLLPFLRRQVPTQGRMVQKVWQPLAEAPGTYRRYGEHPKNSERASMLQEARERLHSVLPAKRVADWELRGMPSQLFPGRSSRIPEGTYGVDISGLEREQTRRSLLSPQSNMRHTQALRMG